jgi:hypothetical protein
MTHDPAILERARAVYLARGFKRVPGWLSALAAEIYAELMCHQLRHHLMGPVCEVGAHLGRTLILLHLSSRPNERTVAFDLYELQNEAVGQERKRRLREYLRRHGGDESRLMMVTCNSQQLTAHEVVDHCGGLVRMFSIDAGRRADEVFADLRLAHGSIGKGGLVSITDYFQEAWPEVSEGCCRFMREVGGLYPVAIGGNKFFLTNDANRAAEYRSSLAARFGNQGRELAIFGMPVMMLRTATLRTRLSRTSLWRVIAPTGLGAALRRLGTRGR